MEDRVSDKLMFYWGFLDSFIDRAENILKKSDIQHLKMLREYVIDAHELIRYLSD
jgi:hypothetical protein